MLGVTAVSNLCKKEAANVRRFRLHPRFSVCLTPQVGAGNNRFQQAGRSRSEIIPETSDAVDVVVVVVVVAQLQYYSITMQCDHLIKLNTHDNRIA